MTHNNFFYCINSFLFLTLKGSDYLRYILWIMIQHSGLDITISDFDVLPFLWLVLRIYFNYSKMNFTNCLRVMTHDEYDKYLCKIMNTNYCSCRSKIKINRFLRLRCTKIQKWINVKTYLRKSNIYHLGGDLNDLTTRKTLKWP